MDYWFSILKIIFMLLARSRLLTFSMKVASCADVLGLVTEATYHQISASPIGSIFPSYYSIRNIHHQTFTRALWSKPQDTMCPIIRYLCRLLKFRFKGILYVLIRASFKEPELEILFSVLHSVTETLKR